MTIYTRPQLTDREQAYLMIAVREFFGMHRPSQIQLLSRLIVENSLLTKEVNEHRAALGYQPLQTYSPKGQS